jgi:hypothetical protein
MRAAAGTAGNARALKCTAGVHTPAPLCALQRTAGSAWVHGCTADGHDSKNTGKKGGNWREYPHLPAELMAGGLVLVACEWAALTSNLSSKNRIRILFACISQPTSSSLPTPDSWMGNWYQKRVQFIMHFFCSLNFTSDSVILLWYGCLKSLP